MEKTVTLGEVLNLVKQLSLIDKLRLIEQVAAQIRRELVAAQSTSPKSDNLECASKGRKE